jgi:hypothetical protein
VSLHSFYPGRSADFPSSYRQSRMSGKNGSAIDEVLAPSRINLPRLIDVSVEEGGTRKLSKLSLLWSRLDFDMNNIKNRLVRCPPYSIVLDVCVVKNCRPFISLRHRPPHSTPGTISLRRLPPPRCSFSPEYKFRYASEWEVYRGDYIEV